MTTRLIGASLLLGGSLLGQPPSPGVFVNAEPAVAAFGTFEFVAAESGIGRKVVKDAPYTGEGVTETVQLLGDGTRITRRSTKKFARDSQGRTREESTLPAIGPWASAAEAPRMVTIHDPVAGETWMLNEKDKTARKLPNMDAAIAATVDKARAPKGGRTRVERDVIVMAGSGGGVPPPMLAGLQAARAERRGEGESLGEQTFDGVRATGTRFTHTIPAGEMGNDRPMVSVVERWHSPELQVLVRSLTKDPQAGETDYRLTGVKRGEPDKALFQVPADYTVKESPEGPVFFERKIERKTER